MWVICMPFLSASHKGTIDQCLLSRLFVRSGSLLRSCGDAVGEEEQEEDEVERNEPLDAPRRCEQPRASPN